MDQSYRPPCHTRLWKLWEERYCGHPGCCCVPSQQRRYAVAHFMHKRHHQAVQPDLSLDCGFELDEDELRCQMFAIQRAQFAKRRQP